MEKNQDRRNQWQKSYFRLSWHLSFVRTLSAGCPHRSAAESRNWDRFVKICRACDSFTKLEFRFVEKIHQSFLNHFSSSWFHHKPLTSKSLPYLFWHLWFSHMLEFMCSLSRATLLGSTWAHSWPESQDGQWTKEWLHLSAEVVKDCSCGMPCSFLLPFVFTH